MQFSKKWDFDTMFLNVYKDQQMLLLNLDWKKMNAKKYRNTLQKLFWRSINT